MTKKNIPAPNPMRLAGIKPSTIPVSERVAPAETPIDAVVAVIKHERRSGWAVNVAAEVSATGEDISIYEWMPPEVDSAAAFLSGFTRMLDSLDTNKKSRVGIVRREFYNKTLELAASWPHVEFHPVPLEHSFIAPLREEVVSKVCAQFDPSQPRCSHVVDTDALGVGKYPVRRQVCATDGSARMGGPRISGYGWITETGHCGLGTIGNRHIVNAELYAILDLLLNVKGPLRVLTDSRAALSVIEKARSRVGGPPSSTGIMQGLYGKLSAALRDRDVIFEKVAGHSGHPLNDGADRLAVYARRAREMAVADDERHGVIAEIRKDTVEAWKPYRQLPQSEACKVSVDADVADASEA